MVHLRAGDVVTCSMGTDGVADHRPVRMTDPARSGSARRPAHGRRLRPSEAPGWAAVGPADRPAGVMSRRTALVTLDGDCPLPRENAMPLLDLFWTTFMIFAWIMWFMLLFRVYGDVFMRQDINGW